MTASRAKKALPAIALLVLVCVLTPILVLNLVRHTPPHRVPPPNPIVIENQRPGTPGWLLTAPATYSRVTHRSAEIEGYASATSISAGGQIQFAVSTTAPTFHAEIYRLGWYGGIGARLVTALGMLPGHFYPLPTMDPTTGLVEAHWPFAFSVAVPATWTTGMYLVKLTSAVGKQSSIPFVVQDTTRHADLLFLHASNTDAAYNSWGGASLYTDETHTLAAQRAFKVSFDRPLVRPINAQYAAQEHDDLPGSGNLFLWEYPLIRWMEQQGYDVSYSSGVDVDTNPALLLQHRGVVIGGHSEYWSAAMKSGLARAVSQGVGVASFGGNNIYRQIRYEPQTGAQHLANHVVVCYKDFHDDPLYGQENALVTVGWRDYPVEQSEQQILGSMWDNWFPDVLPGAPWVVADASSWIFAGTGLKHGDSIPGIVGYEWDRVFANAHGPAHVDVVAASPVTDVDGHRDVANTTVYQAPSGAVVFNAGTIWWSWGMDSFNAADHHAEVVSPAIQRISKNVLDRIVSTRVHES